MKKLFTNYNLELNKNEKKLLLSFCRQSLKQIDGDGKYFAESKSLNSIISKLSGSDDVIKLTKDERTRLKFQLKQNVDFMNKEIKKSWFFKRWLYKSLQKQYENLLANHFEG
ncbi:MAG: hypothetical protein IPM56_02860 [Ignavibacteriales bacterium]|nr:MAG: hypothetical protein IPM56_02860 [Ignavibacteriales bacterium]